MGIRNSYLCRMFHITTDFRIDPPARSGHIEGDGWCWVGNCQDGAVEVLQEWNRCWLWAAGTAYADTRKGAGDRPSQP